jgi:hypothetical protein
MLVSFVARGFRFTLRSVLRHEREIIERAMLDDDPRVKRQLRNVHSYSSTRLFSGLVN